VWSDGSTTETERFRAALEQVRHDRGSTRWSATLSAYTAAAAAPTAPATVTLSGIRSLSVDGDTLRIRCAVNWDLRPGDTAIGGGQTFNVDYLSFFVNASDAYMDVGKRAAA
jgi:hypothetical protein